MSSLVNCDLRNSPRYGVKPDAGITVAIHTVDGRAKSVRAELVDISRGGAKFRADLAIRPKKVVAVRIDVTSPPQTIEVSGEVCWLTPVKENFWYLGCAFQPPLPEEVLRVFAEDGVLERRRQPRIPISVPASAKWELNTAEIPVSIMDYSPQGGVCLLSPSPGQPGGRVELQVTHGEETMAFRGKIQWQASYGECYLVGCEFLTGRDAVRFAEVVGLATEVQTRKRSRKPSGPQTDTTHDATPPLRRRTLRQRFSFVAAACMAVLLWGFVLPGDVSAPRHTPRIVPGEPQDRQVSLAPSEKNDWERVGLDPIVDAISLVLQQPTVYTAIEIEEPTGTTALTSEVVDEEIAEDLPAASAAAADDPVAASVPPPADVMATSDDTNGELIDPTVFLSANLRKIFRRRLEDAESSALLQESPASATGESSRPTEVIDREIAESESAETPSDEHPHGDREVAPLADAVPVTNVEASALLAADVNQAPHAEIGTSGRDEADSQIAVTPQSLPEPPPVASEPPDFEQAMMLFRDGCSLYRETRFEEAAETLQQAMRGAPSDPLVVYVLALAQFQLDRRDQAQRSVAAAVTLERNQVVRDWGVKMEDYQGPARAWLERERRQAREARLSY